MALVYPWDLNSSLGKEIPAGREAEVVSCIEAAQSWIARSAGMRSLEKETTAVTIYLDGREAYGGELFLPTDLRPVWNTAPDLITVTENGSSLSVSTAFSASAGVIVKNAQLHKQASLVRPYGWGKYGANDVAVTCKVGYDSAGASLLPIPEYARRLIIEVALLYFTAPSAASKTSVSKAGAAVSIAHDLSVAGREALDLLRGV